MVDWLVIDGDYLCHRAFYSTGGLSWDGEATGVAFGFLRDVTFLLDHLQAKRAIFCFDHGIGKRREIHPGYKLKRRKDVTEEKKEMRSNLRRQTNNLKCVYLRRVGFRNVFFQRGYEADDMIAQFVKHNMTKAESAVIVSADKDLWQLIRKRVSCYNPQTRVSMTLPAFVKKYGIKPSMWADVKAIAGCPTDEVDGVEGIGEVTAAKFLARKLKLEGKQWTKITSNTSVWQRNQPLVELPFVGVEQLVIREDRVTSERWRAVCEGLGFQSLIDQPPISKAQVRNASKGKQVRA